MTLQYRNRNLFFIKTKYNKKLQLRFKIVCNYIEYKIYNNCTNNIDLLTIKKIKY